MKVIFADDDSQSSSRKERKTSDNILDFTDGIGANVVIVATSNPAGFNQAAKPIQEFDNKHICRHAKGK